MTLDELTLTEHEQSPRSDGLDQAAVLDHLEHGERLDYTVSTPGAGVLSLFRDALDSDHHVIVFTSRTMQGCPVGYIILGKPGLSTRWQVLDVELHADLRGKGFITNLYRDLTSHGYALQSGNVLSTDAERVWLSLGAKGFAQVLDTETGSIEPFSDKPVGDGNLRSGKSPRFVWVTEENALLSMFYRGGQLTEQQRQDWLDGHSPSRERAHLYGVGCAVIEADI